MSYRTSCGSFLKTFRLRTKLNQKQLVEACVDLAEELSEEATIALHEIGAEIPFYPLYKEDGITTNEYQLNNQEISKYEGNHRKPSRDRQLYLIYLFYKYGKITVDEANDWLDSAGAGNLSPTERRVLFDEREQQETSNVQSGKILKEFREKAGFTESNLALQCEHVLKSISEEEKNELRAHGVEVYLSDTDWSLFSERIVEYEAGEKAIPRDRQLLFILVFHKKGILELQDANIWGETSGYGVLYVTQCKLIFGKEIAGKYDDEEWRKGMDNPPPPSENRREQNEESKGTNQVRTIEIQTTPEIANQSGDGLVDVARKLAEQFPNASQVVLKIVPQGFLLILVLATAFLAYWYHEPILKTLNQLLEPKSTPTEFPTPPVTPTVLSVATEVSEATPLLTVTEAPITPTLSIEPTLSEANLTPVAQPIGVAPTPTLEPTNTVIPTPTNTSTSTPTNTATPTPTPSIGSTYVNPVDGAVYVYVPSGQFFYVEDGDYWKETEEFWIKQTEVTNAQYVRCVESGNCTSPGNSFWTDTSLANHPVTHVNLSQAQAYASWVNGRLPNESEWEKACGRTNNSIYPWGNELPTLSNTHFDSSFTMSVDGYDPSGASPYGALGMIGNVWEWTTSFFSNEGSDQPDMERRTIKGGSFDNRPANSDQLKCWYSLGVAANNQGNTVGFRVVLTDLD